MKRRGAHFVEKRDDVQAGKAGVVDVVDECVEIIVVVDVGVHHRARLATPRARRATHRPIVLPVLPVLVSSAASSRPSPRSVAVRILFVVPRARATSSSSSSRASLARKNNVSIARVVRLPRVVVARVVVVDR